MEEALCSWNTAWNLALFDCRAGLDIRILQKKRNLPRRETISCGYVLSGYVALFHELLRLQVVFKRRI